MIRTVIVTDCTRAMLLTVERPLNHVNPWAWLNENTRREWPAAPALEIKKCRMN